MNDKEYLDKIDALKAEIDKLGPLDAAHARNIDEWYTVELTYTSNALEGSTLTRQETAQIIEKDLSVEGKSLRELQEAKNHAGALAYMRSFVTNNKSRAMTSLSTLLDIHAAILSKIDDANAGKLRTIPVRIAGSTAIMPNPAKVPELMGRFSVWLHENHTHPVKKALEAHYELVTIHPFTDGNGRTARILMNLLLMQGGFPPLIVPKESRREYITSLEKAQTGGDKNDYYLFMYEQMIISLGEYIKMVR